jgi:hypothetical protein
MAKKVKNKHIFFNLKDTPSNMGQSQLTDNIDTFISERSNLLPNAKVEDNRLTFDVTETVKEKDADGNDKDVTKIRRGFAYVNEVEDDFQN